MNSYFNYCQISTTSLSVETSVNLELPNQWLWEIIDEFIYHQFQAFSQYRCKVQKKTDEEIEYQAEPKGFGMCTASTERTAIPGGDSTNNKQLEEYNTQGSPDSRLLESLVGTPSAQNVRLFPGGPSPAPSLPQGLLPGHQGLGEL